MKMILLSVLLASMVLAKAENTLTLHEALMNKLVNVQFNGAKPDTTFKGEYSSHYGPCMSMKIANTSNQNVNLSVDYGYRLVPQDSSYQTMLVTQTLWVRLAAGQKKTYRLYAMCSEAHDAGPNPDQQYTLGKRATGSLLSLAELLNRKKYQGDAAQNAVWCLTNDYDVKSIFSTDTVMMYTLRRFVVQAKKLPLSSVYDDYGKTQPFLPSTSLQPSIHYTYNGSLSYNISRTAKVLIALFDESNHMKKVYVNNETQREGTYTYNYSLSSDEMENKKHYLRMFRDGKLEEEITIIPRH